MRKSEKKRKSEKRRRRRRRRNYHTRGLAPDCAAHPKIRNKSAGHSAIHQMATTREHCAHINYIHAPFCVRVEHQNKFKILEGWDMSCAK